MNSKQAILKKISIPFIVNFLSLLTFWLSDVWIISKYDTSFVSNWALLKSVIFISGSVITLGIDQAIVRLSLSFKETIIPLLFQVFIMTVCVCCILWVLDFELNFKYLFCILLLYSLLLILYSYERSKLNYSLSMLILNFWRILFYLLIVTVTYKIIDVPLLIAFLSSLIFVIKPFFKLRIKHTDFSKYKTALSTGFYFFLSACSLNIILFIDQILINFIGSESESEILFSHVTFFISPFAAILGFAGFILTPYLRDNRFKSFTILKKYSLHLFLAGVVSIIVYFYLARWLFVTVKKEDPELWLSVILTFILFSRFVLVVPSSFFGAFANNFLLNRVSISYNLINVVYIASAFGIFYFMKWNALYTISISLLITWLLRVLIGYLGLAKLTTDK